MNGCVCRDTWYSQHLLNEKSNELRPKRGQHIKPHRMHRVGFLLLEYSFTHSRHWRVYVNWFPSSILHFLPLKICVYLVNLACQNVISIWISTSSTVDLWDLLMILFVSFAYRLVDWNGLRLGGCRVVPDGQDVSRRPCRYIIFNRSSWLEDIVGEPSVYLISVVFIVLQYIQ